MAQDEDDDNIIKGRFPAGASSDTGRRNESRNMGARVAVYPYTDKNGCLVARVCRHEWTDVNEVKQKALPVDSLLEPLPPPFNAADDKLKWHLRAPPINMRPLYRLKELIDAPLEEPILFPEGEKDVDSCVKAGFTATTVMGGADNWWGPHALYFEGRHIIVLIDNDDKGKVRGELIRRMLNRVAAKVDVVLPPVGPKGDITDWLILHPGATKKEIYQMFAQHWQPPFDRKKDQDLIDALNKLIAAVRRREGWKDLTKARKIANTPLNLTTAMDLLEVGVRFDEFNNKVMLSNTGKTVYDSFLVEEAATWLMKRISLVWEVIFSQQRIREEIAERAANAHFSPVRDWLGSLASDGRQLLDTWLIDYLGAPDTPLNRAFGRKWLMAAVRRAVAPKVGAGEFAPGIKFDYMLVLEGPQGIGKSTALRVLARDGWFTDRLSFRVEKQRDIMQVITGKIIAEMSELAALQNRDMEDVKSFLSRTHDTDRLAYRRDPEELARTVVFAGTTNSHFFLLDTENRRFWCVQCGTIDLEGLARDREQIWAEAVAAAYTDELLELPKELWEAANDETDKRRIEDPRIEIWRNQLRGLVDENTRMVNEPKGFGREVYAVGWTVILGRLGLDIKVNLTGTSYTNRMLCQIMAQLGWNGPYKFHGDRLFWRSDKDDQPLF